MMHIHVDLDNEVISNPETPCSNRQKVCSAVYDALYAADVLKETKGQLRTSEGELIGTWEVE